MSLLATQYLFNRFSYSLVYCNKVNCVAVQDRQGRGQALTDNNNFIIVTTILSIIVSAPLPPVSWISQYDWRLSSSTEAGWTSTTVTVMPDLWLSSSPLAAGLERMTGAGAVPASDVPGSLVSYLMLFFLLQKFDNVHHVV